MTRTPRFAAILALLTLAVGAVACSDDDPDGGATDGGSGATPSVTVEDAWARTSPMMATNGAVYARLTATVDDRLVAASVESSVAATAEVHETTMDRETDEMVMQAVEAIELPAGETVSLEPGGYHVMLLDLVEPLEAGDTVEVTLVFEEAGEVVVEAEVRDSAMHDG
jgi:copper(I)-binding protein